ncbi:MAG: calcium/sodium antiporter [Calditrichia bacterium]
MDLLTPLAVFAVSLAVLIKASDYFTAAAEEIGIICGMSPFAVGVIIVSVGTSLPELISSLVAVASNSPEIVAGNVIGSNVANIFLILGIGAIIGKELTIKHDLIRVDLPLLLASAFFLALTCWDGMFSRGEAVMFLLALIIFLAYLLKDGKGDIQGVNEKAEKASFTIKPFAIIVVSALFVFLGATYTIESVIKISELLNVGKEVVAVSAVAFGTSLPELMVTISAVKKKNSEMIVGNVLGSNIFNTFAVMGFPGLFSGLAVPDNMVSTGITTMLIASVLFFGVTQDKHVTRWEGFMFVLMYSYFIGKIFNLF